MIERVEGRLAGRQKRYLPKGGKEVPIYEHYVSIPTYFMSLLNALANILGKLGRLHRNFLWDSTNGERKFHLVRWKDVMSPKEFGDWGSRGETSHSFQ